LSTWTRDRKNIIARKAVRDDADHRVRFRRQPHAFARRLAGLRREGLHRDRQVFQQQHGVADFVAIVEQIDRGGRDEDAENRARRHFRSVSRLRPLVVVNGCSFLNAAIRKLTHISAATLQPW
jgi:hypothetical protein